MTNQDILYKIWISSNRPLKEVTLRDIGNFATENKVKLKSKNEISPSGMNYAVLKFILMYCSPSNWPTDIWKLFDQAKDPHHGKYAIWKDYLELKVDIRPPNQEDLKRGGTLISKELNSDSRKVENIFSRSEFLDEDMLIFCEFIVNTVEQRIILDKRGWLEHLTSYKWKGINFREGIDIRKSFSNIVKCAANSSGLGSELFRWGVCNTIAGWAGINHQVTQEDSKSIFESVDYLNTGASADLIDCNKIFEKRIATSSKVYYFSDLRKWTIYDARVSFALHQFACLLKNENADVFERLKSRIVFPVPPTQGNPDERKNIIEASVREGYGVWFVKASILLKAIANYLNKKNFEVPSERISTSDLWEVYHVEMVLFMLGNKKWDIGAQG